MSSKTMNLVQSINSTLDYMMGKDDSIVLLGEDIGIDGGVFRVTEGLQKKYGAERVMDMPLVELGIVGMAIGMSVSGLRAVPEIQFQDFIFTAFRLLPVDPYQIPPLHHLTCILKDHQTWNVVPSCH